MKSIVDRLLKSKVYIIYHSQYDGNKYYCSPLQGTTKDIELAFQYDMEEAIAIIKANSSSCLSLMPV